MNMHNPPHPGTIVKEVLENIFADLDATFSVTEAAEFLGISRISLSKLINCQSGVSSEMAVRLSIALETSSEMWINLQTSYDLWNAEKSRKRLTKEVRPIAIAHRKYVMKKIAKKEENKKK